MSTPKSRGFTLVELMVSVFVVFVFVAFIGAVVTGGCRSVIQDPEDAKAAARQWAQEMWPGHKPGVSCAARDTDGDGYVGCSVTDPRGNVVALECAAALTWNEGCKPVVVAPGYHRE